MGGEKAARFEHLVHFPREFQRRALESAHPRSAKCLELSWSGLHVVWSPLVEVACITVVRHTADPPGENKAGQIRRINDQVAAPPSQFARLPKIEQRDEITKFFRALEQFG